MNEAQKRKPFRDCEATSVSQPRMSLIAEAFKGS